MSEKMHADVPAERESSERYSLLMRMYGEMMTRRKKVWELFDANRTIHADLDLNWIDADFLKASIDQPDAFQIVIATVRPMQTSKAHYHEVGASTFRVLGGKIELPYPQNLLYREGTVQPGSGVANIINEIRCEEGMMRHIPAGTVHQFENRSNDPAHLMIVTHPIICVEEGHEDIHFVK